MNEQIPNTSNENKNSEPLNIDLIIKNTDPQLLALAWENFIKALGNNIAEDVAYATLVKYIRLYNGTKKNPNPVELLDNNAQASVDELKNYLTGNSEASASRFAKKYFKKYYNPKNAEINPVLGLKLEGIENFDDEMKQLVNSYNFEWKKLLELSKQHPEAKKYIDFCYNLSRENSNLINRQDDLFKKKFVLKFAIFEIRQKEQILISYLKKITLKTISSTLKPKKK